MGVIIFPLDRYYFITNMRNFLLGMGFVGSMHYVIYTDISLIEHSYLQVPLMILSIVLAMKYIVK